MTDHALILGIIGWLIGEKLAQFYRLWRDR